MSVPRPSASPSQVVPALAASVVTILMLVVPARVFVDTGLAVSPTHTLQDKTIVLFDLLRLTLPLLSTAWLAWAICSRNFRQRIRSYVFHLSDTTWTLPIILATAGIVRIIWIVAYPTHPYADSEWYYRTASELAAGYGYVYDLETNKPLAAWPVGYPLLLSMLFRLFGSSEAVAKALNVVLSVGCVWLTHAAALRMFDNRVAILAAVMITFLPGVIVYSSLISTDLLFMTLFAACYFAALERPGEAPSDRRFLAIGLLNGALSLVRATALALAPLWICLQWLQLRDSVSIRRCAVLIVTSMFLVVSPWTTRNFIHFGRIIPVSTNGGTNFWIGNNPLSFGGYIFPKDETNPLFSLIGNELEIDRKGYELGFEFMRQHPSRVLELLPAKLFYLYNSNDFGLHWNRLSAASPSQAGTGPLAFALTDLIYVLGCIFASWGAISSLSGRDRNSIHYAGLIAIAYWSAIHLPFFGQDRFALPVLPIIAVYAGFGFWRIISVG